MTRRANENFDRDEPSTEHNFFSSSLPYNSDPQSDIPLDLPSAADVYLESTIPEVSDHIEPVRFDEDIADLPVNKETMENFNFKLRIKNLFINFLNTFDNRKYIRNIKTMCAENKESLFVSYLDIQAFDETLVKVLVVSAESALVVFDEALKLVVSQLFPNYFMIKSRVNIRILDVPVFEELRELRNENLGSLIRVKGIVTRRSGVFPKTSLAKYQCIKCRITFGPFLVENEVDFKPSNCPDCDSRGPFKINSEETVYKDFQKMTVQEIPGTVPAGTLPRSKEVYVFYDLIDLAKPGDEVEVIGIYTNGFLRDTIYTTHILANSIVKKETSCVITKEDEREIRQLAKNPRILEILCNSLAPEICGHFTLKRACLLALFGGQKKGNLDEKGSHKIRGDIHVLLMGDPGTAKSQILRSVSRIAPRAVLATGHGVSSVGLTASVRKDSNNEWVLEGGALVLADNGVVLIDEFDKMQENDRSAIHEAMEQQSISVSKAGIIATLNARCAVIAAANPRKGRYNSAMSLNANVNLSEPILSRFDILCIVRDITDQAEDERIASFIIDKITKRGQTQDQSTKKSNKNQLTTIDDELFKKYLMYAKRISPQISEINKDKISKLYADLRKEGEGSMPITARHIESIVRISEALAKIKLSDSVTAEEVDLAIKITLDSFISAQKFSHSKALRKKFSTYLNENDDFYVYQFILNEMFNEKIKSMREVSDSVLIDRSEYEKRVKSFGIKFNFGFYQIDTFKQGYNLDRNKIRKDMVI
ncbi:DNA replication licensing factor, MCM2 component [Pseudoloma neurophilia]|uniref:DNA replication licensing factor MCM2 n=1 Tax=Pseudoloma neurophilia TaxID=146866 RepID=A0A0R0LZH5_9MICR|nr:DNA replication licensing factor, MCM2 component [Pseudoloma neurophilia]